MIAEREGENMKKVIVYFENCYGKKN